MNELDYFGRERLRYIKQYRPIFYTEIGMQGNLKKHLLETQEEAHQRWEELVKLNKEAWGLTECLKSENFLEWVGLMTNLRETMKLQVMEEIIYI